MPLESWPLDCKGIKPVSPKGNQEWILIGMTEAEAETPIFWSSDANDWLIGKVPEAGKDWGEKETRTSEGEMAGWHHWFNGLELGQTSGDGEGQRGLLCHSPRGCKESDMTGRLNNSNTSTNSPVETPVFLSFLPAWMDTRQRRKRLSFYVGLVNYYIHCKYNQG